VLRSFLLSPALYAEAILGTQGLIAYWPLDDSNDTRARDMGRNGLHGNYQNGPSLNQSGPLDASSVLFNGTSSYMRVPHNSLLDVGDVFTWEFWFRRNRISVQEALNSKNTGTTVMAIESSNNTISAYKWGSTAVLNSTGAITDTTNWHYTAFCKNGTDRRLYVDGADRGTGGTAQTYTNTTNDLLLAADWNNPGLGRQYLLGAALARVALYNRALTAGEVKDHYALGRG